MTTLVNNTREAQYYPAQQSSGESYQGNFPTGGGWSVPGKVAVLGSVMFRFRSRFRILVLLACSLVATGCSDAEPIVMSPSRSAKPLVRGRSSDSPASRTACYGWSLSLDIHSCFGAADSVGGP